MPQITVYMNMIDALPGLPSGLLCTSSVKFLYPCAVV